MLIFDSHNEFWLTSWPLHLYDSSAFKPTLWKQFRIHFVLSIPLYYDQFIRVPTLPWKYY